MKLSNGNKVSIYFRNLPLFAIIFIASLLMMLPYWMQYAFATPVYKDIVFFSQLISAFSEQFWSGDIYSRWLVSLNGGLGAPVFLYYSPGAYYLASILYPLAPWDVHGFIRFGIAFQTALMLGSYGFVRLCSALWPEISPRQAALFFFICPYLAWQIYYSYPLAQMLAISWFPFVLMAARPKCFSAHSISIFAFSMAMLVMIHIITAAMLAPVIIIYVFFANRYFPLSGQWSWRCISCFIVLASMLAVGISSIHWLVMIKNIPLLSMISWNGIFNESGYEFYGAYILFPFVTAISPILIWLPEQKPEQRKIFFCNPKTLCWLIILSYVLFMITPFSFWLWKNFAFMQSFQRPWRFLAVTIIPVAVLSLALYRQAVSHKIPWVIGVMIALFVSGVGYTRFFSTHINTLQDSYMSQRIIPLGDYQTKWMAEAAIEPSNIPALADYYKKPLLAEGEGSVKLLTNASRIIEIDAEIDSPKALLVINRFYMPYWQGYQDILEYHGLLALQLSAGKQKIYLEMPEFPGEKIAWIVSEISFGAAILLLLIRSRVLFKLNGSV
jgi:hypothetical protein